MKRILGCVLALIFLSLPCLCLAEDAIPSMLGTWKVKSQGGLLMHGEKVGKHTHWEGKQTTLEAELVFTNQNGRVCFGYFKSRRAEEPGIGIISLDNKRFEYADTDGFLEGTFTGRDTIEYIYKHVSPSETVIAAGTLTRK